MLFGTMILIAKNNMHSVLCHSLEPLPWSLANDDGIMKTNEGALAQHVQSIPV